MVNTVTKPIFHDGDRIQVLPLDYLKARLRGASGVIVSWVHDDLYYVQIDGNPHEDVLEASEMTASDYKSQSARDAQAANYGDKSFWNYLDESAAEHYAKGIEDAYTQSLGDALKGNDGA